jgi:hypothetical protein
MAMGMAERATRGNPIILHFVRSFTFKFSLLHPGCNMAIKLGGRDMLQWIVGKCFFLVWSLFNNGRILSSQKKRQIHNTYSLTYCMEQSPS